MKTKRPAIVTLTATVLLFVAQAAPAFYNPQAGRRLDRDPLGEHGGVNTFNFVQNQPVLLFDSLGKQPNFGVGGWWPAPGNGPIWWPPIRAVHHWATCRRCCECVTDVQIDSIEGYVQDASQPLPGCGEVVGKAIGHVVKFKVTVQYEKCEKGGEAKLQYIENTDSPPSDLARLGMRPNEDFDSFGAHAAKNGTVPGFEDWQRRNELGPMPCSGGRTFTLTDTPQMAVYPGASRTRNLSARAVFTNPSGCASSVVSAGWTQYLSYDGIQFPRMELHSD